MIPFRAISNGALYLVSGILRERVRQHGIFWVIKRSLFRIILLPLAVVLRAALIALKPMIQVRFGSIGTRSLGDFGMSPELYLCERDAKLRPTKGRDVWYYRDQDSPLYSHPTNTRETVCNQQLSVMWEREMHVSEVARVLDRLNRRLPGFGDFTVQMPEDRDTHSIMGCFPAHLSFTESEKRRGLEALAQMGLGPNDRFVCFHARDSTYLAEFRPIAKADPRVEDLHNTSIHDYLPAVEKLTELGYWAIRMGKYVKEPINCGNPRVIDYATHWQSDFMDVFLSAHCTFFLGQNNGIITLPIIFRRPLVSVNVYPLRSLALLQYNNVILMPKNMFSQQWGRCLTYHEIFELGLGDFFNSADTKQIDLFDTLGLRTIDNTADEIWEAAFEMHQRLQSGFKWQEDDIELQRRFVEILRQYQSADMSSYPDTAIIDPWGKTQLPKFVTHFLKAYRELLD